MTMTATNGCRLAQKTFGKHLSDPRQYVYSLDAFAECEYTTRFGTLHRPALRKADSTVIYGCFGEKHSEWTASPRDVPR